MAELIPQSVDPSKRQSVDQEVEQLLTVLRDEQLRESEPERVVQAILQLGRMKCIAAIDDLVQLLTFRRTLEWEKGKETGELIIELQAMSTDGRYPATGALLQIGKPSLPALIKVIETYASGSLESENAIFTVRMIFADKSSEGVQYLRKAAAKASSSEAAQRLWDAAERAPKFVP